MRLIDLDSLIAEFNKRCRGECCCCEEDYCGSGSDGCGCKVIDYAPTVEPTHGYWVWHGEPMEKWSHGNYCSVCGEYSEVCGNYCPYCGATMDVVVDFLVVRLKEKGAVHVIDVLRNGLHTYATFTSLGENLQYLLIVSHERCKMEEGRWK